MGLCNQADCSGHLFLMFLRECDDLRCDELVALGVGVNAILAEETRIVTLFEKGSADIHDGDLPGLSDFPDGVRVALVPAIDELHVAEPAENGLLVEARAREPREIALGIEGRKRHEDGPEAFFPQLLDCLPVRAEEMPQGCCGKVFGLRVRRNLVPAEVTVVASKFEEGEAPNLRADPVQKMLDDLAALGDGAAETGLVDQRNSQLLCGEHGETFLDWLIRTLCIEDDTPCDGVSKETYFLDRHSVLRRTMISRPRYGNENHDARLLIIYNVIFDVSRYFISYIVVFNNMYYSKYTFICMET